MTILELAYRVLDLGGLGKELHPLAQEVIRLHEAVREAERVMLEINPSLKMSETTGTLTRRLQDYGEMAAEWLAKYGSKEK